QRPKRQVGANMDRPHLPSFGLRTISSWALAALLGVSALNAASAQVITADGKPGDATGEVTPVWGPSSVEKLFPYQSDSMPLGCYGCMNALDGCASCGGCGGGCGGPGCVPGRL